MAGVNLDETVDLLDLIVGYTPSFGVAKQTAGVWAVALADIPERVATAAVHAHYATSKAWITVADIRRQAAGSLGVLAPDPATARAQVLALRAWYGPPGAPLPDPSKEKNGKKGKERPQIHPAVQETIDLVGIEQACSMSLFDWRASYTPRASEFEQRALAPGGIPAARAALNAPPPAPRRMLEAVPEAPETFGRAAELRERRAATTARLDEALTELGDDAQFLLPPGTRTGSRFAQAALVHRLTEYGFDRDHGEAMRRARLEISRHSRSGQAADFEAQRAAALRALEAMVEESA